MVMEKEKNCLSFGKLYASSSGFTASPPGWGAITSEGPLPPGYTRRTFQSKRKKTDEETDEE